MTTALAPLPATMRCVEERLGGRTMGSPGCHRSRARALMIKLSPCCSSIDNALEAVSLSKITLSPLPVSISATYGSGAEQHAPMAAYARSCRRCSLVPGAAVFPIGSQAL